MARFRKILFDVVHNPDYQFYKLVINGKCQFDEFLEELKKNLQREKNFAGVVSLMDRYSADVRWPHGKFRPFKLKSRDDVFEFKKDDIRVYVIKGETEIIIALGGFKQNQKKDENKLNSSIKDLDLSDLPEITIETETKDSHE